MTPNKSKSASKELPTGTPTVSVESLAYGGDGVGHLGEKIVFLPDTVPGDIVTARITGDKGTFFRGVLNTIVTASPDRIEPFCPVADRCGGCQWQMISYPTQCAWKERIVRESLRRIGGVGEHNVESCVPSPAERGFRTVARFPAKRTASGLEIGYFARKTHDIIDIKTCPVASDRVNAILADCRESFAVRHTNIPITEITIRASENRESALITVSTEITCDLAPAANDLMLMRPELAGVVHRLDDGTHVRTYGLRYLEEEIGGTEFRVDERAFFQVNAAATGPLASMVGKAIAAQSGETVVDGYGGVGLFSLTSVPVDATVQLYDTGWDAVRDSVHNARRRGMASFIARREDTSRAVRRIGLADAVIVDPPRQGLDARTIDAVASLQASRVVYVSCNPATLARDLARFRKDGYRVEHVTPVDLFPHTYHIESVAVLKRD
jgi:23S rRNA (uracil1939-C5)-methyltransferase